ncbi:MAG TPA: CDC48 family AAA ATPase [Candidatus Nanoarchaeia archaeon]|nr:CDC48 family AAA ATPase [Candidatus Nanoarchaeia archaeon]
METLPPHLPNQPELKLKVAEAVQDDVNRGLVRIDSVLLKKLGLNSGDIVEIEGGRKTVGIVDRSYPGDINLGIVRMDPNIRRNAKTSLGDIVTIRKTAVVEAKKVIVAPARKDFMIKAPPEMFKQGLLGKAFVKGDVVSLTSLRRRQSLGQNPFFDDMVSALSDSQLGFGIGTFGDLKFIVINTQPVKLPVIVTEETVVEYNPEAEIEKEVSVPEISYEDIGGLEDEIKKIREMVELPLKHPEIFGRLGIEAPKGVLLHGPPGTGKTLLAKAVANETNSNFILINGPEIMSKFYGESEANLRKKFEEAEKNAPSIIFIDEIDAIASKREETRGEVERRVVAQLLSVMDGLKSRGRVVVIAATNRPNSLDPALRRPGRFDREIEIGVPGKEGRLNIMKIHTRGMPLAKNVNLPEIAAITHGFVGADLQSLAKEAAMIVLRRLLPDFNLDEEEPISKEVLEKLYVTQKDFKDALKIVRPSAMREVLIETPNVTWEDVGGLDEVKQKLVEAVEWPLKQPQVFERMGIRPPRGILLYGAPGTGKTMLAKAVAKESEANFILVNGPGLLSMWVGESERALREIFKKARQAAPTIIFFDEIDALAPRRGLGDSSRTGERMVNQLLTEMDGLEELNDVVVIAATNRPDILDSALLRPGRFDRIVYIPVPDEKGREKILNIHIKGMPLEKDINIKELAKKTQGYAGADLEAVCREAAMIALREDIKNKTVSNAHFQKALEAVRPSVPKEVEEAYKKMEKFFSTRKSKEIVKEAKKEKEERPDYMG